MMKLPLIYLALCSFAHAYVQRMTVNRRPTAFRPGVMLQRPWTHHKVVQAASHRTPYVIYRNHPQRHVIKHMPQRQVYTSWKSTRLPIPVTTEREFMRAASAPTRGDGGTGAIHTIPAPNLSLSERPIVVIDGDHGQSSSEAPKPTYEVTEKYPDSAVLQLAKIEQPIGFSKATSLTTPELQELVRNGAALQVASELGLSALALPQHAIISHPHHQQQHHHQHHQQFVHQQPLHQPFIHQQFVNQPILHQLLHQQSLHPQPIHQQSIMEQQIVEQQSIGNEQPVVSQPSVIQQSIIPQRFTVQGFNIIPSQPDLLHAGPDGLVISPNALYQPDPAFMQKLQNQLLQRFPGVEFVPYATDHQPQAPDLQPQAQVQVQSQAPPDLYLLQGEQITKQTPSSFVAKENQRNIFQRETHEGNFVTLVPTTQDYNVTERNAEITHVEPQNTTFELVAEESHPGTTTIRYATETTTDQQNTPPIYYAQVGQNVGNVVASGFYSAINDVRAAAAVAQVDKPEATQIEIENTTHYDIPPIKPELQPYFVQTPEKGENNQTVNEIRSILGAPFAKSSESVNVAYTLLSNDDKENTVSNDGSIYAGQIVEATISEDQDFNKEQANILSKRAPIRLVSLSENRDITTTTPKISIVKAKIPPKSKLTFDDKTGEPVLRIYASYIDSPMHKELIASKLGNIKHLKEVQSRKDTVEDLKAATVKAVDKSQGSDLNQVSQYGLKLRDRSDGPITLFEDYEYEPPNY